MAAIQQKTGLRANSPHAKNSQAAASVSIQAVNEDDELFTPEMRQQLDTVFSRMENPLLLKLYLDDRPVSRELERFIISLASLSGKLQVSVAEHDASSQNAPQVTVCKPDGTETGLAFHGVPSGHEFTSFVLGLYNAAGPGQVIDEEIKRKITAITDTVNMKVLVSLSCTMCPDLVVAAQRIAAENPHISTHVYDIHHFDALKERYHVMSVPCLVINDEKVSFGKKNIEQILALLFT